MSGVLRPDAVDDRLAVECEFIHEILAPARIEGGARPPDRRQPPPHLSGKLGRAFEAGQFKVKKPMGHGLVLVISIDNSARRSAPRASRFCARRVRLGFMLL